MADDLLSGVSNVQANHEKYAHLFDKTKGNDLVDTQTFFTLLMSEMSNQDPLEPMSNTEFVSQMAQFTALQAQQDNLKYNMTQYASTLVGKTVTLNEQDRDGNLLSGVVSGVNISGSNVTITVDGKSYELTSVKSVTETKVPEQEKETELADATALIGKQVTVKLIGEDGNEYYQAGVVDAVEVKDGQPGIVIGDYVYSVKDVVLVENAKPAEEEAPAPEETGDAEDTLSQMMGILG